MQRPVISIHWLPTDPPRPVPDLMTAEEAAIYLRLDKGVKAIERLRARGRLAGYRVGKHVRFRREDLEKFIDGQEA